MKRNLFLFSGILALSLTANAQELKEEYMTWPDSQGLGEYASQWTPGTYLFEDENFYISRVKPKARFRNANTQINETLTEETDKNLVFWVPVGTASGGNPNARPNGKFDSEVFSMWSYVTHYGDWTAPQGWVPGGFADAAHKNGVGVSGVASIPWGSLSSDWATALDNMSKNATIREKVAKFLHYHGVDGLGYNSEFSTSNTTMLSNVRALNEEVHRYLTEQGNPVAENFWYDGTNDNGQINFDQGLGSHNNETFGDGEHIRTSLFLNYNWWGTPLSTFNTGTINSQAPGRSLLDLYAGFNMQGGDPSTWTLLEDYNVSIGLWGAHDFNMLWADRANYGSTDMSKQLGYQNVIEQFFSNGRRNPIDKIAVFDRGSHHPNEGWFGMSAFMTARSSLSWDLATEPFITYFNLGNGQFFNWMGERQNDNEWYNIGVQDYLPTWRFWFASEFLGKTADKVVANGLDAKFTFDDAYVGGSCLRIFGSAADEYLHLFKTAFTLASGDKITVRYKLIRGQADINLALSAVGSETSILRESGFKVLTVADSEADDEVWVEKTFTISGTLASLANQNIAMVALHFENAENLELYLGEFSITRNEMTTPAAPVIKVAKVLASHYKGVDAKVIFEMNNNKPLGEPVYNLDVNASMFKLYAQQENEEPVLMGITTSWAGMYYSIPTNLQGSDRIRLGVAAVSVDMKSDSEISWSEYMDMGEYTTTDEIQINKTTIKPNESFEISYVDPRHDPADWKLLNSDGETVKQASNTTVFSVEEGIEEIGGYDLQVTCNGQTSTYGYYVQITSEAVGALPEIYTLTVDGEETSATEVKVDLDQTLTLGYTGRKADGASSRGIEINDSWLGGNLNEAGIVGGKSFSVSAWVRFTIPGKDGKEIASYLFDGILGKRAEEEIQDSKEKYDFVCYDFLTKEARKDGKKGIALLVLFYTGLSVGEDLPDFLETNARALKRAGLGTDEKTLLEQSSAFLDCLESCLPNDFTKKHMKARKVSLLTKGEEDLDEEEKYLRHKKKAVGLFLPALLSSVDGFTGEREETFYPLFFKRTVSLASDEGGKMQTFKAPVLSEDDTPISYDATEKRRASKFLSDEETPGSALLERGILLHRYLEVVDFKTKAIPAGIFQSEKDEKTIEKVLSLPLFASLEGARIYKEYPYFDETLESNGIIDLLIVRERRIDIVDYKLKNIDDTAYKEQLETYRRNVARLFGAEKEIHTYLLSILDARVEEV